LFNSIGLTGQFLTAFDTEAVTYIQRFGQAGTFMQIL